MIKRLAVFDFDHTIIHDNSDVVAMNLVGQKKIPHEVKQLHKLDGWTTFMQEIFKILHNNNIGEEKIKSVIENLPEVTGMCKLIQELNKNLNFDIIIISDSNSYFINTWLEKNNLRQHVFRVFTNPAQFDDCGILKIRMYHFQNTCKLSTKNLCKGQIMEDFLKEQNDTGIIYDKIVYLGDGQNDFCPILRLKEGDLACVRNNYKCADIVKKAKEGEYVDESGERRIVISNVFVWNNGYEVLEFIKKIYL